jgi:hypothetical protein
MDLLGDVGQMEAHFGLFGDSVNLDARLVHGLCRTWNKLRNHFGCTRWNSRCVGQVDAHFNSFGDRVNLDA